MPPVIVKDEAAEALIAAYADAWDSITAQQNALVADPKNATKRARLAEMRRSVERTVSSLDERVGSYTQTAFPQIYQAAKQSGWDAAGAAGQALFTQGDRQAASLLANNLYQELTAANLQVEQSTQALIRRVGRDSALRSVIQGETPKKAAAEMRKLLNAQGIHAVTYANGAKVGLKGYSEMLIRTNTALALNEATLNGAESAGVRVWEVFDGPSCGWSSHDDPDLAHGRIVSRDEAREYPISHPNCRRGFGPRPDLTSEYGADPTTKASQTEAQTQQDTERGLPTRQELAARAAAGPQPFKALPAGGSRYRAAQDRLAAAANRAEDRTATLGEIKIRQQAEAKLAAKQAKAAAKVKTAPKKAPPSAASTSVPEPPPAPKAPAAAPKPSVTPPKATATPPATPDLPDVTLSNSGPGTDVTLSTGEIFTKQGAKFSADGTKTYGHLATYKRLDEIASSSPKYGPPAKLPPDLNQLIHGKAVPKATVKLPDAPAPRPAAPSAPSPVTKAPPRYTGGKVTQPVRPADGREFDYLEPGNRPFIQNGKAKITGDFSKSVGVPEWKPVARASNLTNEQWAQARLRRSGLDIRTAPEQDLFNVIKEIADASGTGKNVLSSIQRADPSGTLEDRFARFLARGGKLDRSRVTGSRPKAATVLDRGDGSFPTLHGDEFGRELQARGSYMDFTASEATALRKYSGEAYRRINSELRETGKSALADTMEGGMRPIPMNQTAFRGIRTQKGNPFAGNLAELQARFQPGSEFTEQAFSSTAIPKRVYNGDIDAAGFQGQVLMEIRMPKGTRGAWMKPLSDFEVESEFLLASNTRFRVIEVLDGKAPLPNGLKDANGTAVYGRTARIVVEIVGQG